MCSYVEGHCVRDSKVCMFVSLTESVEVKTGASLPALVTATRPERGVSLMLPQGYRGTVPLTQLADAFTDKPTSAHKEGDVVLCYLVSCEEDNKTKCVLSLRKSRYGSHVTSCNHNNNNLFNL